MDIISITVNTKSVDTPDTFVVGQKPVNKGVIVEDSPNVSAIKFFETNAYYIKAYRGPFYIIEFEGSTVKRIIPAENLLDCAVETATKPNPGVVKPLPPVIGEEN